MPGERPLLIVHDWGDTRVWGHPVRCALCGSDAVFGRLWEDVEQGHDDVEYHCRSCDRKWWVYGTDALTMEEDDDGSDDGD